LGVYEARGDLQLVVESMRKAGQGALFEQFLRLKNQLEAEGLFAAERKRSLPWMPRRIGVVTSPGAAAWHDVMSALQRRAPHIPVILSPCAVQGAGAAATLVHALQQLYEMARGNSPVEVILLVRGGGSMEDLWSFNDERLARTLIQSPVPIISGVGHETDFTIADFVADVRAPTPTAAAEMASQPQQTWLQALDILQDRLHNAACAHIDRQSQRLSSLTSHLGRPSARLAQHRMVLHQWGQQLQFSRVHALREQHLAWQRCADRLPLAVHRAVQRQADKLSRTQMRLEMLDPHRVLERGFAWLSDTHGLPVTQVKQVAQGQSLVATLADGQVPVTVSGQPLKP
jgi:exodeoxyribonuclease VII large subunit